MKKNPGPGTIAEAKGQLLLAAIYFTRARYKDAEPFVEAANRTLQDRLGPEHPDSMAALDNLASLHACQGDWEVAVEQFDRIRRLRRSFLARTLPALTDDDQFSLIESGEQLSRDSALSLALMRHNDPGLSDKSAEWALNSKAVALRAQAERAVIVREVTNPEATRLLAEREAIRGRLAMAVPSPGKSRIGAATTDDAYSELVKQEKSLSSQLYRALKMTSTVAPWAGLGEVRKELPPDAILVEFARIHVVNYASNVLKLGRRPDRYAAWLIPPAGRAEVTLVDLGPADAIDSAVSASLGAIQAAKGSTDESHREPDADAARRLSLSGSCRNSSWAPCVLKSTRPNGGCSVPIRHFG